MSIDVNTASREILIALRGISEELANTIISLRPFTSIEELLSIRGIGRRTLERLKRQGLIVGALPQETIRITIPGFFCRGLTVSGKRILWLCRTLVLVFLSKAENRVSENQWLVSLKTPVFWYFATESREVSVP